MGTAKDALADAECPIARAMDVIGDRWSVLIVRDVFDGIRRFGELQHSLGLARNVLTQRLRALVAQGVLETRPASDGTAYNEYALTEAGADLFATLVALRQWGERHLFTEGEEHSVLLGTDHDQPLRELELRDIDGQPVSGTNTYVRKVVHDGRAPTPRS